MFAEGVVTSVPVVSADETTGILVPCGTDLCATGVVQPPLYIQEPWDRVLQSRPLDPGADAYLSLEDEARVAVATVLGVPNDRRLVHLARNEIRAYMYLRLMQVVKKEATGSPLTAQEQAWYDVFRADVRSVRVRRAQAAVDEYERWENDTCSYQPPAGFGFTPLAVDPSCTGAPGGGLVKPPTADQFRAYAAAIVGAHDGLNTADAAATAKAMSNFLSLLESLAAAGALTVALSALIVAFPTMGAAIFAAMGSVVAGYAVGSVGLSGVAAAGAVPTSVIGVAGAGIAASAGLIFVIVIAAAVTAIAFYQVLEGAAVKPTLEDELAKAQSASFRLGDLQDDELGASDMFGVFLARTLPSYDAEALASEPLPPPHTIADPQFLVDGSSTPTDYIQTRTWDNLPQLATVIGSWWAVSVNGGGFRWSPTLAFLGPGTRGNSSKLAAAIDGDDIIVVEADPANGSIPPAQVGPTMRYLWNIGSSDVSAARLHGNHRPTLAPRVEGNVIVQGATANFRANAADPDGDPLTVQWIIEPEPPAVRVISSTDFSNVDCADPDIDPVSCTWPRFNGADLSLVRKTPGTYLARAIATDSKGAKTVSTFSFTVTNQAPLAGNITQTRVGRTVTVSGTITDPGNEQVTMTLIWGDGTTTVVHYPCDLATSSSGCDPLATFVDPTQFTVSHTYGPTPTGATFQKGLLLDDGIEESFQPLREEILPPSPALDAEVTGTPAEGQQLTFSANPTHLDPTATMSVEWILEPDRGSGFVTDPAIDALCRVPTGPAPGCTWPHLSGDDVQRTYYNEGDYLARAAVTDSHGQTVTQLVPFTVANAPAGFTVAPAAQLNGQTSTVTGTFSDPGNDQVRVTIDWGDGSTSTRLFPCDPAAGDLCLGPQIAQRPTSFTFEHVYAGAVPDPTQFPTVSTFDGTSTVGPVVAVVTVETDQSAPTASPTATAPLGAWSGQDVTVTWNWADEGGSGIDPANCTTSSTSSGDGVQTLSASCHDLAGNVGTSTFEVWVDRTAPTLSPTVPSGTVLLGGTAVAVAGASDGGSGVASATCGPVSTDVLGSRTVQCTAVDAVGNSASASATYTVGVNVKWVLRPSSIRSRSGSMVLAVVQLTGADGRPIPDAVARSLPSCSVTFTLGDQTRVCASYIRLLRTFVALVSSTSRRTVGTSVPLVVAASSGGTEIGRVTTSLTVVR